MKKVIVMTLAVCFSYAAVAQSPYEDQEKKGFKKQNLFTGGAANVNFFNGQTVLGVSPYFGYSVNRFLDVAASLSFNYISQRDYLEFGDKIRQTMWAPGAFVRVYPVKFLFAQAQYEHAFIKQKYIPASSGSFLPSTGKADANVVLVGAGIANGRTGVGDIYYYTSVMFDVTRTSNSPYVDELGRALPIIRVGLNIPLFNKGGNYDPDAND